MHLRSRLTVAGFVSFALTCMLAAPAVAAQPEVPNENSFTITMVESTGTEVTIQIPDSSVRIDAGYVHPGATGSGDLNEMMAEELDVAIPTDLIGKPTPPVGAESRVIIGTDDRTRIADPTRSPYVQMPFLVYTKPDGKDYTCTGWLYDNRTIGTAAHCLTDGAGTWYTNYRVYFGMNGTTAYARCGYNVQAAPKAYDGSTGSENDWGILVANCYAGQSLGHLGYRVFSSTPSGNWSVTGYPGDKVNADTGYTMWTHAGAISARGSQQWEYQIDTTGGQSGAPLWRLEAGTSCGNCVIGIHATGNPSGNFGPRITNTVAQAFAAYANSYP